VGDNKTPTECAEICKEVNNWMKTHHYNKIDDLIGAANI